MKCVFILVIFFVSGFLQAQIGIIQDPDGYTNVRSSASSNAPIIHKIHENEAFFYWEDDLIAGQDWITVYINKDPFTVGTMDESVMEGYVHKSRIRPIQSLPMDTNHALIIQYQLQPFDTTGRIIDRSEGMVTAIDGRWFWGTDGTLPYNYIQSAFYELNGTKHLIHPALLWDLYQCGNNFTIYKNDDTWLAYQSNSDGAGYYEIVWIIDAQGIQQRLVGSSF